MTGGWAGYSWPPAIALTSTVVIFLMDFGAERFVETKYEYPHEDVDLQRIVVAGESTSGEEQRRPSQTLDHRFLHSGDQREDLNALAESANRRSSLAVKPQGSHGSKDVTTAANIDYHPDDQVDTEFELDRSFRMQIAAFLILEFGVVFHSVIIGLNLGTAGSEFSSLYPVLVFHQSFEGLGIGARMSAIPFPKPYRWLPWALCAAYGLTTPIAIAIGLGLRTTYDSGSFTANVVSGVLDSVSAGILLWTGLVELLARDFLFDPKRTKDNKKLIFMVVSSLLGAALMALLGKWA